jgi:4,5-DOPA dioxygenase extradiol
MELREFGNLSDSLPNTPRMPVVFIGHGSPMNALWDNPFTRSLVRLGRSLPRPSAVLVVSAHWITRGTSVSVNPGPRTIHDFGGFDDRLFHLRYEPAGHPTLARASISAADGYGLREDPHMGLDHGAWTVLRHMWPEADVPVFQLSLDGTQPAAHHFSLGSRLRDLRDKGVLILGSGNIVHNLGRLDWQEVDATPFDWSAEFDGIVKAHIDNRDFRPLVEYPHFGSLARMAVPTNDHYLPLLYVLAATTADETARYVHEGFQHGSVSMRSFVFG